MSSAQRYIKHVYTGFESCQRFDAIKGGHIEHRLLSPVPTKMEHQRLALGKVRLESCSYDFPVVALGAMPAHAVSFVFQSSMPGTPADVLDPGSIHIYPPKAELLHCADGPSNWRVITMEREHLQATALRLCGREASLPVTLATSIRIAPTVRAELVHLTDAALVIAREHLNGAWSERAMRDIESLLSTTYATALTGEDANKQCPTFSAAQRHNYLITACERMVLSGLDTEVTLREVARRSGYSLRSLELIFKSRVGMPPKRWFLMARLNGALRDLLQGDVRHTVSSVAMKWGFRHMSRFSEQYCDAFGELPRQTLARGSSPG